MPGFITYGLAFIVIIYYSSFSRQILRKDEEKTKDLPLFLGFSPSGVVERDIVYANFGTVADFRKLKAMGVSVKDKIVLVRQGRVFRGNKVVTYELSLKRLTLVTYELSLK